MYRSPRLNRKTCEHPRDAYNEMPRLFFFQAEDGIRDGHVTGVQTCALPIYLGAVGRDELRRTPHLRCGRLDLDATPVPRRRTGGSEERRVGKECRSRWS